VEYCNEIETLKNDNNSKKTINELQAIVQEQSVKLQHIERNEDNDVCELEEESHGALEVKQIKVSDLKKYKMKFDELEKKYKEVLEVKQKCEI